MAATTQEIKKESSILLKLGGPIIATQLMRMGLNFTDTVMAGNLSALDLAGVAIGNAMYLPLSIFCMATLIAINPIVSEHLGARRFKEIGTSARQMFWLVLMLTVPTFFLTRNLDIIMNIVGVTDEIVPIATDYLKAISWGLLPLFAYAGVRYFSEGLSVTKPAMYIAAVSLVLNVGANYIFMYGGLGITGMGAVGAGYATSLINLFAAIVFIGFMINFKPFKRFDIFARTKGPDLKIFSEFLKVGLPNGASTAMEILLFASVSVLMGTLSVEASASHQIAINVAATLFMIPFGLSMAITQRVGFSIGQGSLSKARLRGFIGIGMCASIMTLTAVMLFSIPETIIGIYTDDPLVSKMSVSLLFMAGLFQISDGLQVGGFGALRGLKDTRTPMIVNFIAYWLIGFPIGYYLGIISDFGPEGLWIGLISGLSVAAILHNFRFHILTAVD
ncbi:MAG TPA: MATE family efflux transporter [Balneola sp.]|jgi:MATE family multidrug resistance protein|nr:MATE family efflux transporter [Balneola sp.]MAO76475.1 MATE family efflux transporter [Balneola sp.]MBF65666.1 MATE family efflux transporter [Balneola sp.]HCT52545.1 MATE family efflux transporter [Balneola sp.]|tara:strand:+ start:7511 stop:8851 length:1341 start_codon:yes stop_codon:yes gene_type:complete